MKNKTTKRPEKIMPLIFIAFNLELFVHPMKSRSIGNGFVSPDIQNKTEKMSACSPVQENNIPLPLLLDFHGWTGNAMGHESDGHNFYQVLVSFLFSVSFKF